MNNWLFLRGDWDCRTEKSIHDDDDMWLHLFGEIIGDDHGTVFFRSDVERYFENGNYIIMSGDEVNLYNRLNAYSHGFSRGGFPWQADVLRRSKKTYTIRYGAGKRFLPEVDINYDLILVDSYEQQCRVKKLFPKSNPQLFIKPAAKHFKPVECEKEYDICFIAKTEQKEFKGVDWVYETAPKDLKILHLGSYGEFNQPSNITTKRVDRIDMPEWISKCNIGIVPYFNKIDSCPRIVPEMLACGLQIVISDMLVVNGDTYPAYISNQAHFWQIVKNKLDYVKTDKITTINGTVWDMSPNYGYYNDNLSIPIAAKNIKRLIGEK